MAKRANAKLSEPREIARSMREEYEKRTGEVGDTVDGLRKEFKRRTEDVRGAAEDLRNEYDKRVGQASVRLSRSIDDSRETVQEHPFLAVGVTLGIGIIAGVLLGRKSKA
jgi:ElaB/YqjD/DUF883 family membrane-anchored ribosome-binding protein